MVYANYYIVPRHKHHYVFLILVDKILIGEDDDGLHITVNLNADFTNHLQLFDNNGNLLSDNLVKPPIAI